MCLLLFVQGCVDETHGGFMYGNLAFSPCHRLVLGRYEANRHPNRWECGRHAAAWLQREGALTEHWDLVAQNALPGLLMPKEAPIWPGLGYPSGESGGVLEAFTWPFPISATNPVTKRRTSLSKPAKRARKHVCPLVRPLL